MPYFGDQADFVPKNTPKGRNPPKAGFLLGCSNGLIFWVSMPGRGRSAPPGIDRPDFRKDRDAAKQQKNKKNSQIFKNV